MGVLATCSRSFVFNIRPTGAGLVGVKVSDANFKASRLARISILPHPRTTAPIESLNHGRDLHETSQTPCIM